MEDKGTFLGDPGMEIPAPSNWQDSATKDTPENMVENMVENMKTWLKTWLKT
jgi:hypothetical protein